MFRLYLLNSTSGLYELEATYHDDEKERAVSDCNDAIECGCWPAGYVLDDDHRTVHEKETR